MGMRDAVLSPMAGLSQTPQTKKIVHLRNPSPDHVIPCWREWQSEQSNMHPRYRRDITTPGHSFTHPIVVPTNDLVRLECSQEVVTTSPSPKVTKTTPICAETMETILSTSLHWSKTSFTPSNNTADDHCALAKEGQYTILHKHQASAKSNSAGMRSGPAPWAFNHRQAD